MCKGRHIAKAGKFGVTRVKSPFVMGVTIGPGMEFNHGGTDPMRRLDILSAVAERMGARFVFHQKQP
jgi:hypothetical protein